MSETLRFHEASLFAGKTGTVDNEGCVIFGVSVITSNVEAEGHGLQVDDETVSKLHSLATAKGKVPVLLDHGSGIEKMNGYLKDFRLDGGKLRADWYLLKSHKETPMMLERAESMPECFGLSAAFKGSGVKVKGGKKAARAEKLLSVDCVTRPAANAGLFSAKDDDSVDTSKIDMAKPASTNEPTLAEVLEAINGLKGDLATTQATQEQIIAHINSSASNSGEGEGEVDPAFLEQLFNMSPQQLAEFNRVNETNITRAEIVSEVQAYNESIDAANAAAEGEGEGQGAQNQPGATNAGAASGAANSGQGEGAAVGGGEGGGVAFKALQAQVLQLQRHIENNEVLELQAQEEMQFAQVNEKIVLLSSQRDRALELASKLVAQVEALELHVKTGTRPVKPGVDNGVRLFSANSDGQLHQFQANVKTIQASKNVSEGQAIQLASRENPELHADWLQSQKRR